MMRLRLRVLGATRMRCTQHTRPVCLPTAAFSAGLANETAWMNPESLKKRLAATCSPIDKKSNSSSSPLAQCTREELEEQERMLVTALVLEDQQAVHHLHMLLKRVPPELLHPDSFGNLLVGLRHHPAAARALATPSTMQAWISSWGAPAKEGWRGGVGGRGAAVSSIIRAYAKILSPGSSAAAAAPALHAVLSLYTCLFDAHNAGTCAPLPLLMQHTDVAALHRSIKWWHHWAGAAAATLDTRQKPPPQQQWHGAEDVILRLYTAQVLSHVSADPLGMLGLQPALALIASLDPLPSSTDAGGKSDMQVALHIFEAEVLRKRAPHIARQDLQVVLTALCAPDLLSLGPHFSPTHSQHHKEEGDSDDRSWQRLQDTAQEVRYMHAAELFMRLAADPPPPPPPPPASSAQPASQPANQRQRNFTATEVAVGAGAGTGSLISPASLEIAFRIAGVSAHKKLHAAALREFHLQASNLTERAYNRVVNSALLGLRDWHSGGLSGGPSPPPTTATEYFPIAGENMTSPAPALHWLEGHRQINALLATLPPGPAMTEQQKGPNKGKGRDMRGGAEYPAERARHMSMRLFMTALKDCNSQHLWASSVELLEQWLRVGQSAGDLTPRMLFLLTTAFVHLQDPVRALKLLEVVHTRHGTIPDTDTFRLLCLRLFKLLGPDEAERAWLLARAVYSTKPCPLYWQEGGFRHAGPCLASKRAVWLLVARRYEELGTHMRESVEHMRLTPSPLRQAVQRHNFVQSAALLKLYNNVVWSAVDVNVDISIHYLHEMLELLKLPTQQLRFSQSMDDPRTRRTIDRLLNKMLEEGRTVRAAALVQELHDMRGSGKLDKTTLSPPLQQQRQQISKATDTASTAAATAADNGKKRETCWDQVEEEGEEVFHGDDDDEEEGEGYWSPNPNRGASA